MALKACWIYTVFNNILEVVVSAFVIEMLIMHQRVRSADEQHCSLNFNVALERTQKCQKKKRHTGKSVGKLKKKVCYLT